MDYIELQETTERNLHNSYQGCCRMCEAAISFDRPNEVEEFVKEIFSNVTTAKSSSNLKFVSKLKDLRVGNADNAIGFSQNMGLIFYCLFTFANQYRSPNKDLDNMVEVKIVGNGYGLREDEKERIVKGKEFQMVNKFTPLVQAEDGVKYGSNFLKWSKISNNSENGKKGLNNQEKNDTIERRLDDHRNVGLISKKLVGLKVNNDEHNEVIVIGFLLAHISKVDARLLFLMEILSLDRVGKDSELHDQMMIIAGNDKELKDQIMKLNLSSGVIKMDKEDVSKKIKQAKINLIKDVNKMGDSMKLVKDKILGSKCYKEVLKVTKYDVSKLDLFQDAIEDEPGNCGHLYLIENSIEEKKEFLDSHKVVMKVDVEVKSGKKVYTKLDIEIDKPLENHRRYFYVYFETVDERSNMMDQLKETNGEDLELLGRVPLNIVPDIKKKINELVNDAYIQGFKYAVNSSKEEEEGKNEEKGSKSKEEIDPKNDNNKMVMDNKSNTKEDQVEVVELKQESILKEYSSNKKYMLDLGSEFKFSKTITVDNNAFDNEPEKDFVSYVMSKYKSKDMSDSSQDVMVEMSDKEGELFKFYPLKEELSEGEKKELESNKKMLVISLDNKVNFHIRMNIPNMILNCVDMYNLLKEIRKGGLKMEDLKDNPKEANKEEGENHNNNKKKAEEKEGGKKEDKDDNKNNKDSSIFSNLSEEDKKRIKEAKARQRDILKVLDHKEYKNKWYFCNEENELLLVNKEEFIEDWKEKFIQYYYKNGTKDLHLEVVEGEEHDGKVNVMCLGKDSKLKVHNSYRIQVPTNMDHELKYEFGGHEKYKNETKRLLEKVNEDPSKYLTKTNRKVCMEIYFANKSANKSMQVNTPIGFLPSNWFLNTLDSFQYRSEDEDNEKVYFHFPEQTQVERTPSMMRDVMLLYRLVRAASNAGEHSLFGVTRKKVLSQPSSKNEEKEESSDEDEELIRAMKKITLKYKKVKEEVDNYQRMSSKDKKFLNAYVSLQEDMMRKTNGESFLLEENELDMRVKLDSPLNFLDNNNDKDRVKIKNLSFTSYDEEKDTVHFHLDRLDFIEFFSVDWEDKEMLNFGFFLFQINACDRDLVLKYVKNKESFSDMNKEEKTRMYMIVNLSGVTNAKEGSVKFWKEFLSTEQKHVVKEKPFCSVMLSSKLFLKKGKEWTDIDIKFKDDKNGWTVTVTQNYKKILMLLGKLFEDFSSLSYIELCTEIEDGDMAMGNISNSTFKNYFDVDKKSLNNIDSLFDIIVLVVFASKITTSSLPFEYFSKLVKDDGVKSKVKEMLSTINYWLDKGFTLVCVDNMKVPIDMEEESLVMPGMKEAMNFLKENIQDDSSKREEDYRNFNESKMLFEMDLEMVSDLTENVAVGMSEEKNDLTKKLGGINIPLFVDNVIKLTNIYNMWNMFFEYGSGIGICNSTKDKLFLKIEELKKLSAHAETFKKDFCNILNDDDNKREIQKTKVTLKSMLESVCNEFQAPKEYSKVVLSTKGNNKDYVLKATKTDNSTITLTMEITMKKVNNTKLDSFNLLNILILALIDDSYEGATIMVKEGQVVENIKKWEKKYSRTMKNFLLGVSLLDDSKKNDSMAMIKEATEKVSKSSFDEYEERIREVKEKKEQLKVISEFLGMEENKYGKFNLQLLEMEE